MKETEKIVRIEPYCEGFARVVLDDGMFAFVDENGKLQEGRYRDAWAYSEGFAPVKLDDGKWAFIDKDSKLQEGRYRDAWSYSEGLAVVMLDVGKFAFVDKNGKLQEGRYNFAWQYREGFATVKLDDDARTETTIDKSGNMYLRNEQWLDYIKKAPLSFKFIPPQYFNDEEFIESIDNAVKDVYVNKVKTVDSALNDAEEKFAEIRDDFENFCKMRVEKIKAVEEILRKEKQGIEQAKEDLIQQINNLDVGKDRG